MKNYILITLFIFSGFFSFAQDSTGSGGISIGLNFSGVPVTSVSGVDTIYKNALSISPSFGLRSKGGWGIAYSPSFVTSANRPGIYMHTITAGYERYGSKIVDLDFHYSHYFFTNKTSVPFSPLTNEIYLSI